MLSCFSQHSSISSPSNIHDCMDCANSSRINSKQTQTILTHEVDENMMYYQLNYTEELVKNESVIQEATLAGDELEEGFPKDRFTQTILSGNHRPTSYIQVNRLPMKLEFRLKNIFTGELCSAFENDKSVQTLVTYI